MKNEADDDDDDDTSTRSDGFEAREGLRLLLGGVVSFDADAVKQAFQNSSSIVLSNHGGNDKDQDHDPTPDPCCPPKKNTSCTFSLQHDSSKNGIDAVDTSDSANFADDIASDDDDDDMFSLAFKSTSNGLVERPSVRVVNMDARTATGRQRQDKQQKLGNGMSATRFIAKGEVIYTERASVACQIPECSSSSSFCNLASSPPFVDRNCSGEHDGSQRRNAVVYSVRACQWCFRSLEPASSCSYTSKTSLSNSGNDEPPKTGSAAVVSAAIELPLARRLWPIPEFEWILDSNNNHHHERHTASSSCLLRDQHGRVHCQQCLAWFCSDACCQSFEKTLGSHCLVTRSTQCLQNQNHHHHADNNSDNDCDDDSSGGHEEPVQAAVALAVRTFCQALQHYRTTNGNLVGTFLDGLCGEATEMSALELGIRVADITSTCSSEQYRQSYYYTLDPFYRQLLKVWDMTAREQEALSLEYFHQLAVISARNGIGLQTQCPFQTYYAGLLRESGRGSAQSLEYWNLVAQVLSSSFGTSQRQGDAASSSSSSNNDTTTTPLQQLDRDMDRRVSERVAPEIVALFPLTARINHSCQPNAQVQGQVFCDCHLDLTATQDIPAGQEITISYIHGSNAANSSSTGQSTTTTRSRGRRRRELQAKYLFECHCSLCSGKGR